MSRRAEQVDETRQRIVDATVHLHSTVGPARTTISAIAEQAGVTRLTVYRHFPDQEVLFAACSQEWERRHPAPDPEAWLDIEDPVARALHGLRELYGWYREHGEALLPIYRDVETFPPAVREATLAEFQAYADALVAGSRLRGRARARLEAAASHAVNFWTWRSLCVEQALDEEEAAGLAASLLAAAAGLDPPHRLAEAQAPSRAAGRGRASR